MTEELIKNVRLSVSGRKLLTSQQKAFIVEDWKSSSLSCPEYCRRHGLIINQVYNWRSDAKSVAINKYQKSRRAIFQDRIGNA
jgi:transposase-like protein